MESTSSGDPVASVLGPLHDAVLSRHDEQRGELLARLPEPTPTPQAADAWPVSRRFALSGMGLGAAAAVALAALWLSGAASRGDAMERMAAALDRVASYTFRMESVYVSTKGDGRTVRQVNAGIQSLAPLGLHAKMHIVETPTTNTAPGPPKVLVDLEETHRAPGEGPGILIDHLKKQCWWVDGGLSADSDGDIQKVIFMVRKRYGRVLRDLGEREVEGRLAAGFEFILEHDHPVSELGPGGADPLDVAQPRWPWLGQKFEVWVDPATDLPIEFHSVRRGKDFETTSRFTDLKWNVEVGADTFTPTAPEGYEELEDSPLAE